MNYKEEIGDLVEDASKYDVVLQGCNCQNRMGAGIAKFLRQKYPEIYEADTIAYKRGEVKLGNYSKWVNEEIETTFVNCYTQYGTTGRLVGRADVDYDAIRKSFKSVNKEFAGKRVGIPLIGCGLAGGDWSKVGEIIDEELSEVDPIVVFLLSDYIKIKMTEFFKKEYDLDRYDSWMNIELPKGQETLTYFLDLPKMSIHFGIVPHMFKNQLETFLSGLNCVSYVDKKEKYFFKLKITDDFKSYYK